MNAGEDRFLHRAICYIHVAVLALLVGGCGARPGNTVATGKSSSSGESSSRQARHEPLVFLVAASTKDAVEELAARFAEQTGVQVRVSPGPSNALAAQVAAGAPADLLLSANEKWVEFLQEKGLVEASAPLLSNGLALIVPRDNPGAVRSPTDLARPRVKRVALAGENVPAGIYAGQALRALGLYDLLQDAGKIIRGQDVRMTLGYVARGEVAAGIVYDTDARMEKNVLVVDRFDPQTHDHIIYPLVLIKRDPPKAAALKLFKALGASEGIAVFEKFGFQRAPGDGAP